MAQDIRLMSAVLAFEPGAPDQASFKARLARETGWDSDATEKAIQEYRRFIYLAAINPSVTTPSDVVDQVWHLHMVYTKSYWDDLCRDVVGRVLHHDPAAADGSQREHYREAYADTLALYRQEFGEDAPREIWPPSEQRFPAPVRRQVDLNAYWLVRKPRRSGASFVMGLGALVMLLSIPALGFLGAIVGVGMALASASYASPLPRDPYGGVPPHYLAAFGASDGDDDGGGDGGGGDGGGGCGCGGCGG